METRSISLRDIDLKAVEYKEFETEILRTTFELSKIKDTAGARFILLLQRPALKLCKLLHKYKNEISKLGLPDSEGISAISYSLSDDIEYCTDDVKFRINVYNLARISYKHQDIEIEMLEYLVRCLNKKLKRVECDTMDIDLYYDNVNLNPEKFLEHVKNTIYLYALSPINTLGGLTPKSTAFDEMYVDFGGPYVTDTTTSIRLAYLVNKMNQNLEECENEKTQAIKESRRNRKTLEQLNKALTRKDQKYALLEEKYQAIKGKVTKHKLAFEEEYKAKSAEFKVKLKEQEEMNKLYVEENKSLRMRISELEKQSTDMAVREAFCNEVLHILEEDDNEISESVIDIDDILTGYRLVIVGGHQNWRSEVKNLLRDKNIQFRIPNLCNKIILPKLNSNDILVVNVKSLSHSLYYKIMGECEGMNIPIVRLGSNSVKGFLPLLLDKFTMQI